VLRGSALLELLGPEDDATIHRNASYRLPVDRHNAQEHFNLQIRGV